MITKKASKLLVTLLAVMLWQSSAAVQAADAYSQIVTFGDSLTDPGNAFVLLHTSSVPPFNLVPDAPPAQGVEIYCSPAGRRGMSMGVG